MRSNKILKRILFWSAVLLLPGGSLLLVYKISRSERIRRALRRQFDRRKTC